MTTIRTIVSDYGTEIEVIDCDGNPDDEIELAMQLDRLLGIWLELQDDENERTAFTVHKNGDYSMYGFRYQRNGNLYTPGKSAEAAVYTPRSDQALGHQYRDF